VERRVLAAREPGADGGQQQASGGEQHHEAEESRPGPEHAGHGHDREQEAPEEPKFPAAAGGFRFAFSSPEHPPFGVARWSWSYECGVS